MHTHGVPSPRPKTWWEEPNLNACLDGVSRAASRDLEIKTVAHPAATVSRGRTDDGSSRSWKQSVVKQLEDIRGVSCN